MNRFEIHGHRGCRGLLPENTIKSFQYALDLGVNAIELDVVVSADNTLIVSHDPWIDPNLSVHPQGNTFEPKEINIYRLHDTEIQSFKVGELEQPEFPDQKQQKSSIPSLQEVIDILGMSESFFYNIEIKSDPAWYEEYQPQPEVYASLVSDFLKENRLTKFCMVQCFDPLFLNHLYELNPSISLGLLTEKSANHLASLEEINFKPSYYNPDFQSVTKELVDYLHKDSIKITPWTVNELEDMKRIIDLGVDGIITDYPDRAQQLFHS